MNVHLVDDEKFINGAIDLFEQYAPGENLFLVNSVPGQPKYVNPRKEVVFTRFTNMKGTAEIRKIIGDRKLSNLYVHFMTPLKAVLANLLKNEFGAKTFWVFYGADLYGMLHTDFGYVLHDEALPDISSWKDNLKGKASVLKFNLTYGTTHQQAVKEFIKNLDFFCFWNTKDYELLRKYYPTQALNIPFIYFNAIDRNLKPFHPQKTLRVIVNNSASANGNHATILRKINHIDDENKIDQLLVPLSYGNAGVKSATMALGRELFGNRFNPLTDFMDKDSYFGLLDEISVAFFGSRRQEAAGNIFQLLAKGVKVFLRNDNNMREYLAEKGFVAFSFEDDFNAMADLGPLSAEEMQTNRDAFLKLFSEEEESRIMEAMVRPGEILKANFS